jgi:hypothetical protein
VVTKFSCLVVSNLKLDESETGVSEKKLFGNFKFRVLEFPLAVHTALVVL